MPGNFPIGDGRFVEENAAHHFGVLAKHGVNQSSQRLAVSQLSRGRNKLQQTTNAESIYEFAFPRKMVLVVGNERLGLTPEELQWLDRVVEIPVYGLPHSYNVHTSTAMALYEYCKQYPQG